MPKHGKKFNNAVKDLDRTVLYSLKDGIKNVLQAKYCQI